MHITEVGANIKGGVKAKLGPKTLIIGPSASGKTAIINAVELALTSQVSDLRYREAAAADQLIAELGTRGEPLSVAVTFDDGSQAAYGVPKGKLKGQAVRPSSIDPARVMPIRQVLAALRGDAETTRKFLLAHIVGALTVADLQIPESLQLIWKSAIASTQRTEALVDVVTQAIEAAEAQARSCKARAVEQAASIEQTSQGLPARPDDELLAKLKAEADQTSAEVTRLTNLLSGGSDLEIKKNTLEQRRNDLGLVTAAQNEARAQYAALSAQAAQLEGSEGLLQTLEALYRVVTNKLRAMPLDSGAHTPTDCPVCRSGINVERLTQVGQALAAKLNELRGQPRRADIVAQLAGLSARGQYQNERIGNLQSEIQSLEAALAVGGALAATATVEDLSKAIATAQEANTVLAGAVQLRSRWDSIARFRDQVLVLERQKADWERLAEHLNERILELVDNRAAAWVAKVQARLPDELFFDLKLRDGKRSVCYLGLKGPNGLRTALSGYEQAVVLAAVADVCAGDQPYWLLVVPDRQMDSKSLTRALKALVSAGGQVLMTSTVEPESIPDGWTVVRTGQLTSWSTQLTAGAPGGSSLEQKLADLAEETTGKPKKPAKPAKPAKTPFIDVGDGLLTEADMAANAKLADELEAKQREDEFKRNVEQAAQKLKAEAKADPKADPKAESKPKRKYTRKAKP